MMRVTRSGYALALAVIAITVGGAPASATPLWSAHINAGGSLARGPSAGGSGFTYSGTDGAIYDWNDSSGHHRLGGNTPGGAVSAVRDPYPVVWYRGGNGALWQFYGNSHVSWGGQMAGDPAPAVAYRTPSSPFSGPFYVNDNVAFRGTNGHLFMTAYGGAANVTDLGGALSGGIAAWTRAGIMHMVYQDNTPGVNTLVHQSLQWGSQGWQRMGGYVPGTPAVAADPSGTSDSIFYTGSDHQLYRVASAGQDSWSWSGHQALGGYLPSDPVATFGKTAHVFYRGGDGQLWWVQCSATSCSEHRPLGGALASDPAVITQDVGGGGKRTEVAYRGQDGHLYYLFYCDCPTA